MIIVKVIMKSTEEESKITGEGSGNFKKINGRVYYKGVRLMRVPKRKSTSAFPGAKPGETTLGMVIREANEKKERQREDERWRRQDEEWKRQDEQKKKPPIVKRICNFIINANIFVQALFGLMMAGVAVISYFNISYIWSKLVLILKILIN